MAYVCTVLHPVCILDNTPYCSYTPFGRMFDWFDSRQPYIEISHNVGMNVYVHLGTAVIN